MVRPTTTPIACWTSLLANGETPQLSVSDAEQDAPARLCLLANQGLAKAEEDTGSTLMTSPARRRSIPVHARPACNS
ncbi:MAG: hypothetical protein ACLTXH_00900 [Enterobacter hormaechei]